LGGGYGELAARYRRGLVCRQVPLMGNVFSHLFRDRSVAFLGPGKPAQMDIGLRVEFLHPANDAVDVSDESLLGALSLLTGYGRIFGRQNLL
jgi:hypothetical protein